MTGHSRYSSCSWFTDYTWRTDTFLDVASSDAIIPILERGKAIICALLSRSTPTLAVNLPGLEGHDDSRAMGSIMPVMMDPIARGIQKL